MLHVIFLLFKIIGLILLVLLGLIVGLLLILLLVPIRYRVRVSHGDELKLEGRVSWLLHLVHARVSLIGDQRHILLRIFGIVLYDNQRPKKPKDRRSRGRNRSGRHNKEVSGIDPSEEENGFSDFEDGQGEDFENTNYRPRREKAELPIDDTIQKRVPIPEDGTAERKNAYRSEKVDSSENVARDRTAGSSVRTNQDGIPADRSTTNPDQEEEEERESFFGRVLRKIRGIFRGISNKLRSIREGIKRTFSKILNLKKKLHLILEFLKDEENKQAFQVTFSSLKKLLKHILPTRLKSEVTFGTGDPCSTGKALGAISILYSFYGDNIRITPDFENKIFEGNHYARGRIRIGSLLIILIRLILDKKFKQLKRNFKILKEAL